ncbi:MAG: 3-hydroxyacyl-CoA dehydrogenase [Pseudomonadales bacterium]
MSDSNLDTLTVLGGGVLGAQIAWHSAFHGKKVIVYDLYEEGLENCRAAHENYSQVYLKEVGATDADIHSTRGRLTYTTKLQESVADADIVIEAAPEIPEVKTKLYLDMAPHLPERTIVATNSSTLLPSQFAEATGRPDKYCALHFANQIWSINFAELMAHQGTSDQVLIDVASFSIEIGMVPIPIEKEQNGYVCNSLLVPLLQAAQSLVTNGVSSPESVDRTYMIMNRGCTNGPCGIMDMVGFKTVYDIFSLWGEVNKDEQMLANAKYLKEHFLDKGMLGLQTGQGYYTYPNPSFEAPDFLDVPDVSNAKGLAMQAKLT